MGCLFITMKLRNEITLEAEHLPKGEYDIDMHKYPNGVNALVITDSETGEAWMTATTNLPIKVTNEEECVIKDYSENSGIQKALVDAGVIELTGESFPLGYGTSVSIAKIIKK